MGGSREVEPLLSSSRTQSRDPEWQSKTRSSIDTTTTELAGYEETRSSWYLLMTTLALGGLQIAWSVELSSISVCQPPFPFRNPSFQYLGTPFSSPTNRAFAPRQPFLLSLGLSKSLLALVWIAGPLSGTLVQPYIGIRSDNCRLRWGRRKPFMVGGAVATMLSLLALAWTREAVGGTLGLFGFARDSTATTLATQAFAVLLVYVLDFAINVIQAATRAFIVDCAPTHQQESANAWASRVTGVGNIVGYLAGYANLPSLLPWLGDTQFKVLCAIACAAMAATLGLSCASVAERDPRQLGEPAAGAGGGVVAFFRSLLRSARRLPRQIRMVCLVQVCAWVAWFPFLFYITTYVGQIYADPYFRANPNLSDAEINDIFEHGTRVGTLALFVFAITTFASSVLLPFMVAPTYRAPPRPESTPLTPSSLRGALTPSDEHGANTDADAGYFDTPLAQKIFSRTTRRRGLRRRLLSLSIRIPGLTLRRAWLISHIALALCLWSTLFVRGTLGATILVAAVGVPWAVTNWAPFALIAAEISKRDAIRRGLRAPPNTAEGRALAAGRADPAADQAGVVLGIHNVAVAAPQVIATLGSSAIFALLQKPRGQPGDDSVAWVLRVGGLCALAAAFATRAVGEGDAEEDEDEDVEGVGPAGGGGGGGA